MADIVAPLESIMPVPDYQTLMRPVLGLVLDKETPTREITQNIADLYKLTSEEREERIPSGTTTLLANRVHWAITYMVKAGLLDRPRRAVVTATDRGKSVFHDNPERIGNGVLSQFVEFQEFKQRSGVKKSAKNKLESEIDQETNLTNETPEERIDSAAEEFGTALRDEILSRIVKSDPVFFEHLIIDLMLAMGYGGSGSGKHLGRTADGGVDGVINEDPLGLDIVFLQAKRYASGNVIGVAQIREFAGSLDERGAVKGVFVTTSTFASAAKAYAERSPKRLVLIDGDQLTRLLINYGVGVRSFRVVDLKKIDEDYFSNSEI